MLVGVLWQITHHAENYSGFKIPSSQMLGKKKQNRLTICKSSTYAIGTEQFSKQFPVEYELPYNHIYN